MTINARPSPDFENQALAFIRRGEGNEAGVYGDPVGIPTVGYGYALIVKNAQGIWVLKDTLIRKVVSEAATER